MTMFGVLQWYIVMTGANPQISRTETAGAFISANETLDLTDDDFFFAFSILDTNTKEEIFDDKLIKFMGMISEGDGVS